MAAPAVIRDLAGHAEYEACVALQRVTWGDDFRELVPPAMLLVAQKVGGVLLGAFEAERDLVGFVFGLTGLEDGRPLHWSHMLAVRPDRRDRGIGRRLKLAQRERLLGIGVARMLWTFDPLVARNAHINLTRLGTRVREYVTDMYGDDPAGRLDQVIGSDRFIVQWDLNAAPPEGPAPGLPAGTHAVTDAECIEPLPDDPVILVRVPDDIQRLKDTAPEAARRWRAATRRAFTHYLAAGYRVTGFGRSEDGPVYALRRQATGV